MQENESKKRWQFTSESVTEGHPDKVCDQVADAILDHILEQDPSARVACEVVASTGLVLVTGEITTKQTVDVVPVVRDTIRGIGYTGGTDGFDADSCSVLLALNRQSPDISNGVTRSLEARLGEEEADSSIGAGDQGMMFGYACDETPEYMPLAASLAHELCRKLAEVRHAGTLPYLRPDGKAQVTLCYEGDTPVAADTLVVSAQHDPDVTQETLAEDITRYVVRAVVPEHLMTPETRILINPSGRFVTGGPQGDSGLTGRKIIVDTYGGYARHGGGSFSGKDPTKVDRTATYAARYAAKNVVAAGLAQRCEIQLSYAIGVARPVSIMVETFGTGTIPDGDIAKLVQKNFDLRPASLIRDLDLRRPLYRRTAAYGHFGRPDLDLPWERIDRVEDLRHDAGLQP